MGRRKKFQAPGVIDKRGTSLILNNNYAALISKILHLCFIKIKSKLCIFPTSYLISVAACSKMQLVD